MTSSASSSVSIAATSKSLLEDNNVHVLPGDCLLRHDKDIIASSGTYLKNGYIFASVAGLLKIEQKTETHEVVSDSNDDVAKADEPQKIAGAGINSSNGSETKAVITKRVVTVDRPDAKKVPFLEPGSIVTARVLRTTASFVKCSIHCIEDHVLKQPYTGIIRVDDIRDYEREKINITKCFRPGDIILARVFASGENHQFLLTTAAPELGVVIATNEWGEPMIPITLNEVLCQRTFTKEPRKVAKIDLIA